MTDYSSRFVQDKIKQMELAEAKAERKQAEDDPPVTEYNEASRLAQELYKFTGDPQFKQRELYYSNRADRAADACLRSAYHALRKQYAELPWWKKIFRTKPKHPLLDK